MLPPHWHKLRRIPLAGWQVHPVYPLNWGVGGETGAPHILPTSSGLHCMYSLTRKTTWFWYIKRLDCTVLTNPTMHTCKVILTLRSWEITSVFLVWFQSSRVSYFSSFSPPHPSPPPCLGPQTSSRCHWQFHPPMRILTRCVVHVVDSALIEATGLILPVPGLGLASYRGKPEFWPWSVQVP